MFKRCLNFLLPLLLLLSSCDRSKEVEIDLPHHVPQLVIECYLTPGEPLRMTVLESSGYFDTPQPPLVPDAIAYITHNGNRYKLSYKPYQDEESGKFYTHVNTEIMQGKPGEIFGLEVTDNQGRRVTGFTTILPAVPIDTVEWRFNEKSKAYLLTTFQDNPNRQNFYRYMVNRDTLEKNHLEQDIIHQDDLTNGKPTSFGSAYNYEIGDTLVISLYNIEKQYYDFLNSASNAKEANGNPFMQPSSIKSSVTGGIGIFTNLAFDRKTIIIKE